MTAVNFAFLIEFLRSAAIPRCTLFCQGSSAIFDLLAQFLDLCHFNTAAAAIKALLPMGEHLRMPCQPRHCTSEAQCREKPPPFDAGAPAS